MYSTIQYWYQSDAIRDEYPDMWPNDLACVPRVGDHIQGTKNGFILRVMAVTLLNQREVEVILGMIEIGVSDPVFARSVLA